MNLIKCKIIILLIFGMIDDSILTLNKGFSRRKDMLYWA